MADESIFGDDEDVPRTLKWSNLQTTTSPASYPSSGLRGPVEPRQNQDEISSEESSVGYAVTSGDLICMRFAPPTRIILVPNVFGPGHYALAARFFLSTRPTAPFPAPSGHPMTVTAGIRARSIEHAPAVFTGTENNKMTHP